MDQASPILEYQDLDNKCQWPNQINTDKIIKQQKIDALFNSRKLKNNKTRINTRHWSFKENAFGFSFFKNTKYQKEIQIKELHYSKIHIYILLLYTITYQQLTY